MSGSHNAPRGRRRRGLYGIHNPFSPLLEESYGRL